MGVSVSRIQEKRGPGKKGPRKKGPKKKGAQEKRGRQFLEKGKRGPSIFFLIFVYDYEISFMQQTLNIVFQTLLCFNLLYRLEICNCNTE